MSTVRARSLLAALLTAVVVAQLLQRAVLVLPLLAALVGAALGAVVLVALERRRDGEVVIGGAAVGVVTVLASMLGLAVLGMPVLSAVYLAGWVVTFLLAAGAGAGIVWLGGRVAEHRSGSPRTLR